MVENNHPTDNKSYKGMSIPAANGLARSRGWIPDSSTKNE